LIGDREASAGERDQSEQQRCAGEDDHRQRGERRQHEIAPGE